MGGSVLVPTPDSVHSTFFELQLRLRLRLGGEVVGSVRLRLRLKLRLRACVTLSSRGSTQSVAQLVVPAPDTDPAGRGSEIGTEIQTEAWIGVQQLLVVG